jgi:hypothetical protein
VLVVFSLEQYKHAESAVLDCHGHVMAVQKVRLS